MHPPVQFLAQAAFLNLIGLNDQFYPFMGTYVARLVNVFAAAVTAALLFLLVERLRNMRTATIASLILLLDPFVVRINRRNMLETMAEMWVLAALYLYWNYRDRLTTRNLLGIGALWAGNPHQELVFFNTQCSDLCSSQRALARSQKDWDHCCGCALHLVALPLLGLVPGTMARLWQTKPTTLIGCAALCRLPVGTVKVSPSLALSVNIYQYGTSYLLVLLGAVMIPLLLLVGRSEQDRFVLSWNITAYGFFAYTIGFGTINDQFFYFLLVPVILCCAYVVMRWVELLTTAPQSPRSRPDSILLLRYPQSDCAIMRWIKWADAYLHIAARWLGRMGRYISRKPALARSLFLLTLVLGLAFQGYNGYRWVKLYVLDTDNSLFQLSQYIKATLPPGTRINSMFDKSEPTLKLMLPNTAVSFRQPGEI